MSFRFRILSCIVLTFSIIAFTACDENTNKANQQTGTDTTQNAQQTAASTVQNAPQAPDKPQMPAEQKPVQQQKEQAEKDMEDFERQVVEKEFEEFEKFAKEQEQQNIEDMNEVDIEQEVSRFEEEAAPVGPRIKFNSYTHDFGIIGPGSTSNCTFEFTNVGSETLIVEKRMKASCGCTVPTLNKLEYAPGESGKIDVTYKAGNRPGKSTKYIYVKSYDPKNPKVTLAIKSQVEIKVDYQPQRISLRFDQPNAGCPPIVLTSKDENEFRVRNIRSTDDVFDFQYDPNQAKQITIQPQVNMDLLRKNPSGRIYIVLTHPGCQNISIPYAALEKFKVTPPSITIFNCEPGQSQKRRMWVLNNYADDFELGDIKAEKGLVKITDTQKMGSRYEINLEITPPEKEGVEKYFTDVLHVNIKDGPKFSVNCRGFYKNR